jgi:malonyl-ACP O-methyltransferase BioC
MNIAIDKEKVKRRFGRCISSYNDEARVQKSIVKNLVREIVNLEKTTYHKVLEIGCGTGFLTNQLLQNFRPDYYAINDIVETVQAEIEKITLLHGFTNWSFLPGDAEKLTFPSGFDLVVSTSTVQWFQFPAAFFNSVGRLMPAGGILAFSTFGMENFRETKTLQTVSLKYPSRKELISWLSSSFEIIHCSEEIIRLDFASPRDVLKHIRHTGVNSLSNEHWNRCDLYDFEISYKNFYSNPDGTVSLTYHPIIVIARKKK